MRVSTIDVGTNTVRLLVADVEGPGAWRVVTQHQTVTRLGEGLAAAGALGAAPMARTLAVVAGYVERGCDLGASDVRIVATSAVREAANGRAFAEAVERATGRRVEVVSGEDEARLMLRGVRSGLGRLDGRVVVFDIGGGATEDVLAARAALPCLEPGRADLIVPGIAIVLATLDAVGADGVVVSDSGLREGILAAAADAAP